MRAHQLLVLAALTAVVGVACGDDKKTTTPDTAKVLVTVKGTVRNLTSTPDSSGVFAAATPAQFPYCNDPSKLSIKITLLNVAAFLLAPDKAVPIGECLASATDGAFACENVDITDNTIAVVAVYDDVDNTVSDCIAPSAAVMIGCKTSDLQDPSKTSCGSGQWLADNTLAEADKETLSNFVIPQALISKFDAELATDAGTAAFGKLSDTGAVLVLVLNALGQPTGDAQPYLPADCASGALTCRTVIPHLPATCDPSDPATCIPTVLPTTNNRTDARVGMWFAQLIKRDGTGAQVNVKIDATALGNDAQAYGAIDCSAAATKICYSPFPSKPVRKDERGAGTPGLITIAYVTPEEPSATTGKCLLEDALTGMGASLAPTVCQ